MPVDQLRLDITTTGGPAALTQLDQLDARLRSLPQTAQQSATGAAQATSQLTAAWEQQFARSGAAIGQLGAAWGQTTQAAQAAGPAIAQATAATAAHASAATAATAGTSQLGRAFVLLGTQLSPLPNQFNTITAAGLSLGGVTPVVAGVTLGIGALTATVGAAVAQNMAFERAMSGVRAILPVAAVAQYNDQLEHLALTLGQRTIFTATEAAQAIGDLARSGMSLPNILNGGATAALNLAAATGTNAHDAALALGTALKQFELDASHADEVTNLFAAAVHIAGLSADELRQGLRNVGPQVHLMGGSLQDATTGLEVMARAGIDNSQAGTQLMQLYRDLNPRTHDAAALMNELGLITEKGGNRFFDAQGNVKSFDDIARLLATTLGTLTKQEQAEATQLLFSQRGAKAAMEAMQAYKSGGLDQIHEAQMQARTSAEAMAERLNNLWGATKQLESSTQTLAVQLGGTLAPALEGIVHRATDAVNAMVQFNEAVAKSPVGQGAAQAGAAAGSDLGQGLLTSAATVLGGPAANLVVGANTTFTKRLIAQQQAALQEVQAHPIPDIETARAGALAAGAFTQDTLAPTAKAEQAGKSTVQTLIAAARRESEQLGPQLRDDLAVAITPDQAQVALAGQNAIAAFTTQIKELQERGQQEQAAAAIATRNRVTADLGPLEGLYRANAEAASYLGLTQAQLNDAYAKGTPLTAANAAVLRDRAEALADEKTAVLGGAVAIRDHDEALAREKDAALGGAVAIRDHAEALARDKEAQLGGALAVRDHEEALAREKDANLGGAVAIRAHQEALAREKEATLGGALALRAHEEALAREKEANLGGVVAIRDHQEALAQEREAALGGALALRDHEEALAREKDATLGGALAIRDHADALQQEHEAALGGAGAIRDHADQLAREHTAALGGEQGIRAHSEALNEEKIAALGGRAAMADHAAGLRQLDVAAEQSRTVFTDLADRMANYAKSVNPVAVQAARSFQSATQATSQIVGTLTNDLAAHVVALQNAANVTGNVGLTYDALALAIRDAHLGYQDIEGILNNDRDATARLSEALAQQNQLWQAQHDRLKGTTAALNELLVAMDGYQQRVTGGAAQAGGDFFAKLLGAQYRSGQSPGGGTEAYDTGATMARGFRENVGSGPEQFGREIAEGFGPSAAAALQDAAPTFGSASGRALQQTVTQTGSGGFGAGLTGPQPVGLTPEEFQATQQRLTSQAGREGRAALPSEDAVRLFAEQSRQATATEREEEKARQAQQEAGLTAAQREARRTGVPSYQSILDADRQQAAQRQLDRLTQGLSLAARASVEFTVQTRGAEAALESLGGKVDVNAPEAAAAQQAAGAQTRGSLQDLAQQAAALTAGSDVVAAAAARAGAAAAAQAAVGGDVAKAAQQASEGARAEWSVVIKEAGALLKGELVSAFGPIPATQIPGGGDQPALYASALQPGTSTLRTVGGEPAAQAVQIIINNPTFQNAGADQVRAWRQAARAVR